MADDEPEIEEVLDSLDELLNKEGGDSAPDASPQEGEEAAEPQATNPAPQSHRLVLTEAMLVEESEELQESEGPEAAAVEESKPSAEVVEAEPEPVVSDAAGDTESEAESSAPDIEAEPEEVEPSPADEGDVAGIEPEVEPAMEPEVPPAAADQVVSPEPESAPEPEPEQTEAVQPEPSPVQAPGAPDLSRMVDVDVLFGVMQQVSADVTARIAEELPEMIEEALNRHLSGLNGDRDDQ